MTSLFILGTLIIGTVYLKSEWQERKNLSEEMRYLRDINTELDRLIINRDDLLEEINRISKSDLDRVRQAVPVGSQEAELMTNLEQIAGKNGLVLKNIEFEKTAAELSKPPAGATLGQPKPGGNFHVLQTTGPFKELPFSLILLGTYESLKAFLDGLEKNIRIVDIKRLTLGASGTSNVFGVTVKAKVFNQ